MEDPFFEDTGPGGTYLARRWTDERKHRSEYHVFRRDDEGNERLLARLMFKDGAVTLCRRKAADKSVL